MAPPGSGKTLTGIEIARRIGRPVVAFAPTTTIQEQWADKVRLFLPEGPDSDRLVAAAVSTDPSSLRSFSALTYQSLSTQTQAREFLDRLGRQVWVDELVNAGRTLERAYSHLAELASRAPEDYDRGVAVRSRRAKRDLLASGEARFEDLLHPNALDLVTRIVAQGTGCIVLDEAHHLLDYWALILTDLIARLPDALVVGLTATPPASAEPEEMGNYLALVDGIDFEVPTPAVVRAGHLAPYQDLVLITSPTDRERRFLESQHGILRRAIDGVFADPRFPGHVRSRIERPDGTPWHTLMSEDFDLCVAGVRYLFAAGAPVPDDVEVVPEMRRPPAIDDELALVRDWCMHFLRFSKEDADRTALADLRALLRTLGMAMTETGWRSAPTPIDRVLAYSESKVAGMVEILRAESESMDVRLRAVVLTDFERSSATALRRLDGVLDPESGGAVQAIRALVADPVTAALDPVMVTGRTVIVDAGLAPRFVEEAATFLRARGLGAEVRWREAERGLAVVEGTGANWAPRHYVALVTGLFERGVTRCLVGTRGLLAEGWDSLSLNTLVDLTTAGTFASVNQIRGRSIRLDPAEPRKVANNWDVACVATDLDEGRRDLHRFAAKHRHVWGVGPSNRIVRGVAHVDERLLLVDSGPSAPVPVDAINRSAFRRAWGREAAYRSWGVGQPYENFEFRGTVLGGNDLVMRTAFTWTRSLRALLNLAVGNLVAYLLLFLLVVPRLVAEGASGLVVGLTIAAVVLLSIGLTVPLFWRYVKAAFIELPVDSYLADFGRAVAEGLRESGIAAASPDAVRVSVTEAEAYEVHLDTASKTTAELFAEAYGQLFAPIVDQRYLVVREEASLRGTFYRPVWYVLRRVLRVARRTRPSYHPVPDVFGRNRERAEAFARAWGWWVGGRTLVYTRSGEGISILLGERSATRRRIATATVDEWR